jgi:hypothetical protein
MAMSDSATDEDSVCRYPRLGVSDVPEEWIEYAKETGDVLLLGTDKQVVFVQYVESEQFGDGYTWATDSVQSESGRRSDSWATDSLVERWFSEAASRHNVWPMDIDETPLRNSRQREAALEGVSRE